MTEKPPITPPPEEESVRKKLSRMCRRILTLQEKITQLGEEEGALRDELVVVLDPDTNEGLGNRCVYFGHSFTRATRKAYAYSDQVNGFKGEIKGMNEHLGVMRQLEISEGVAVLTKETPYVTVRKVKTEDSNGQKK